MALPACAVGSSAILVSSADICANGASLGYTDGGITITYEPSFFDVYADQLDGKIARVKTDETLTVAFALTSMTLENIRLAMGLPDDSTVWTGTPEADTDYVAVSGATDGNCLSLGSPTACGSANRVSLVLIGEAPACCARAYIFPCAEPTSGFEITLSRDTAQQLSVTYEVYKLDDDTFGRVCDDCSGIANCAAAEALWIEEEA